MYDDSDLDAAVASGALPASDAQALRRFVAARRADPPPAASDPYFRYVASAADLLPTLGVALLLAGVAAVTATAIGYWTAGLIAIVAWTLSHRFAPRRAAGPTGLLFLAFIIGCACTLTMIAYGPTPVAPPRILSGQGSLVAGGCAVAGWAYWRRFRLPLAVPVALLAAITLGDHFLMWVAPSGPAPLVKGWSLLSPLLFLAAAMWWDASDVYRQTARSDVAFWLHAIAGYRLSAALFKLAFGASNGLTGWAALWSAPAPVFEPGMLVVATLICLGLGSAALIIDRRSLLMCGMMFLVGASVRTGLSGAMPAVLIGTGGFALALTLNWAGCRRMLLQRLPIAIRAQLPRSDPRFWYPRPVA